MNQVVDQIGEQAQRPHVHLTSSGSAAIIAGLKAAALPTGSEVLIPAICCPAVLFAVQFAGYSVRLADVDRETFNCSAEEFEKALSSRTKALIAVHGFGRPCDIEAIEKLGRDRNLLVVEDACLNFGASYMGRPVGSFGHFSVVSFGYDKPVTCGYGGAIMSESEQISQNVEAFLSHNEFLSFSKMDTYGVMLEEQMANLDGYVQTRIKNVQMIESTLDSQKYVMPSPLSSTPYWRYPILIESNRGRFLNAAQEAGLIFSSHYKNLGSLSTGVNLPNAEYISPRILNLFVRPSVEVSELKAKLEFLNGYTNE